MDQGLKRKREVVYPRVTYNAGSRTFDRLLKENSLDEMKDVVRKKLGYSDEVPLQFAQLRDGRTVDLEDDDDFEAFCSAAHSSPLIIVQVTATADAMTVFPQTLSTETTSSAAAELNSKRRKKKRKMNSAETLSNVGGEKVSLDPQGKKRKVAFSQGVDDEEDEQEQRPSSPKKRQRASITDAEPRREASLSLASALNDNFQTQTSTPTAPDPTTSDKANTHPAQSMITSSKDSEAASANTSTKANKEEKKPSRATETMSKSSRESNEKARKKEKRKKEKQEKQKTREETREEEEGEEEEKEEEKSENRSVNKNKRSSLPINGAKEKAKSTSTKATTYREIRDSSDGPAGHPEHQRNISNAEEVRTLSEPDHESESEKQPLAKPSTTRTPRIGPEARAKNTRDVVDAAPKDSEPVVPAEEKRHQRRREKDSKAQNREASTSGPIERLSAGDGDGDGKSKSKAVKKPSLTVGDKKKPLTQEERDAIQAVLDRVLAAPMTKPTSEQESESVADATIIVSKPAPVKKATAAKNRPKNPLSSCCPICNRTPLHSKSRCPFVRAASAKALETRLVELQAENASDGDGDSKTKLIEEIKTLIQKKVGNVKANAKAKVVSNDDGAVSGLGHALLPSPGKNVPPQSIKNHSPIPKSGISHSAASIAPPLATVASSSELHNAEPNNAQLDDTSSSEDEGSFNGSSLPKYPAPAPKPSDISMYSDIDLEAVIRGPNVSLTVKDIPSTESSEADDYEENEELFEDNDNERINLPHHSKSSTPDSSDEEASDDADEDEAEPGLVEPTAGQPPPVTLYHSSRTGLPSSSTDVHDANLSFHDVDNLASSIEIDRTGDRAFSEALAEDTAVFKLAVENAESGNESSDEAASPGTTNVTNQPSLNAADALPKTPPPHRHDSIQPFETPANLPVSPIDEPFESGALLSRSTPRGLALRMKDRSGKVPKSPIAAPSIVDKGLKLLNGLNRHQLGIPPPNSTRTRTRSSNHPTATPTSAEIPTAQRVTRSSASQPQAHPGTVEAAPKSLKKPRLASQPTAALPATRSQKAAAAQRTGAKGAKERGKKNSAGEPVEETGIPNLRPDVVNKVTMEISETPMSLNTWEVLNDQSSQLEGETTVMVDELQSSPEDDAPRQGSSSLDRDDNAPSSQKSLFIPSESQHSFPYSQWNGGNQPFGTSPTPNQSDDEEEVEQAIIKQPPSMSQRPSQAFRRLTDITASQLPFRASIPSARRGSTASDKKTETLFDLYGTTGEGESDASETNSDSESDSESDTDKKKTNSHIPKSRRAGVVRSRA